MTKILFSNPPFWEKVGDAPLRGGIRAGSRWPFTRETPYAPGHFRFGSYIPFPVFLSSAAGWMEQVAKGDEVSGHGMRPEIQVFIRDSIARGESYAQFGAYLDALKPDWIVIESASSSWDHDQRVMRQIKHLLPNVQFVVCGPITAGDKSKEALAIDGCVAAVRGEYEKGCVRVILNGERGVIPHDIMTKEEMNGPNSRWPKWDEECAKNYFDACPKGQRPVQLQMWASRGCPHVCQFCVWPAQMTNNDPDGLGGRKVRFYAPEWVEGYIKERVRIMGPLGCVYFDDDTFNLGDKHVSGICDVMAKLQIPWAAMCRADTISGAVWEKMKASGCYGVKIGFESGSDRVVNRIIGKKLDLKEAADTARWLRKIGIAVHGTFMVGLPGETPEEKDMTLRFIQELYQTGGLDTHQLSGTATLDGTPLANMKEGVVQKNFPEAKKDANFIESPDGQKKIEQISNSLVVR